MFGVISKQGSAQLPSWFGVFADSYKHSKFSIMYDGVTCSEKKPIDPYLLFEVSRGPHGDLISPTSQRGIKNVVPTIQWSFVFGL